MALTLYDGKVKVKLTDKDGRWSIKKLSDEGIVVRGECHGYRVNHEYPNFAVNLIQLLDRLNYPHRRERGDWLINTQDETPLRFSCTYCGKERRVYIKAKLSDEAVNEAKRRRRQDSYSGLYGGLVQIRSKLKGGKFEGDWRPIVLICSECGHTLTERNLQNHFDQFKRRVEDVFRGRSEAVEPASQKFRIICLCRNELLIDLSLSAKLPETRAELFDALLDWMSYASDEFQEQLTRIEYREPLQSVVSEDEGEASPTPPSLLNATKVKVDDFPNA